MHAYMAVMLSSQKYKAYVLVRAHNSLGQYNTQTSDTLAYRSQFSLFDQAVYSNMNTLLTIMCFTNGVAGKGTKIHNCGRIGSTVNYEFMC